MFKQALILFLSLISLNLYSSWQILDELETEVHLYTPSSYDHRDSYPLMINLHGCSQKALSLKKYGNWEQAADQFETIVVIPQLPEAGPSIGCWDYYGMNHSRSRGDSKFILDLVDLLKKRYNIREDKVFISGLSSGGGLSMVLACLAPDVFSGVGLNAAPSLGTQSYEISRARISVEKVERNCLKLAGRHRSYLREQKVSVVYGDNDFVVDPQYNVKNAEVFAKLFKASTSQTMDLNGLEGVNLRGNVTLYSDDQGERVSLIMNKGIGHNWPGGQGGFVNNNFVTKNSVNYPLYLLGFLLDRN